MKTSKKIFISLLGTIAFLILAAFIDIRINSHRNSINLADHKYIKQIVPPFKVLYINSSNVDIVQNDSSLIEINWMKDTLAPRINYSLQNDTLTVSDINLLTKSMKYLFVKINVTDSLKSILLKNANINVENLRTVKITLDMDKSYVWFYHDKSYIRELNILAKNHSHFYAGEFRVDSIGIALDNSEANLGNFAKKIVGTLSDSSSIYSRHPLEISLKKDSTSKININDY